ncbi:MAG TPA: hypothetical protein VF679_01620 [Pedobacter sp.]|jgi:hypothetical protein
MNRTYTNTELISLIGRHQEFITGIRKALKYATVEKDILEMRRMLYNVNLLAKNTRVILDNQYVDGISSERLQKDIQRTAV